MRELGRVRDGELDADGFAAIALSDAYFGCSASERERVGVGGEQQGAPLLALVSLLPDEHTGLRESLLHKLGA